MPDIEPAIRLKANRMRVRAMYEGHVIADTNHAIVVLEAGHPAVQYFPREDVEMGFMGKTAHHTLCPLKGEASYFTLTMGGQIAENAAWSYETPRHGVLGLKDYIAFYPNVVEVYELTPSQEAMEPRAARPHTIP